MTERLDKLVSPAAVSPRRKAGGRHIGMSTAGFTMVVIIRPPMRRILLWLAIDRLGTNWKLWLFVEEFAKGVREGPVIASRAVKRHVAMSQEATDSKTQGQGTKAKTQNYKTFIKDCALLSGGFDGPIIASGPAMGPTAQDLGAARLLQTSR